MKQLILVGNQKVKFQDTETTISLTLVSDGNTVTIDSAKTYSVKIKNGTGYVKAITATPDTDNNMVTFSTAGFDGLPVDAYFIELWVLDTKGQTIYPSDSFIELDITANATGVQGQVVPAITLQEFEDRFGTLQSDLEAKVSTLIGPTGATGNGVSGVSIQYQLGADGNTIPTGTWSDTPSTPTDALPYMWTRNVTTYTDKSTSTSYNISAKGTKGNNFTIQGSTKTISGLPSTGVDGEGYMVGTELYVWTNGKWNDIVNMKGDKGDQGIQGIQGLTGNGISGVSTQYQLGTDGATIPTGTWNNTPSTPTDALPYMWTRNVTTYTDKSTHTSYNISAKGTKGNNFTIQGSTSSVAGLPRTGTDGEGYMVGTELYVWTNGKWNDIVNMKGVQGDRGIQGIQGIKGDTGNGIKSTSTDYQLSAQGVEVPNTGWSTTIPVTTNALPYLWTRVTITFTDGSQHVIYFTSNKGDKGDKGDTGEKGDTGANLAVKGALDKSTSLPSTGNSEGDAYLVGTDLYVYTKGAWKNCGPIVAENTVLYNADGSLNVNGTNFNYVQDLRNGKIQYNDGTKNVQLTPMDAGKEASDILAARSYTDTSVSALSNSVDTKLSSKANTADLSTGLSTKVTDNKNGTIQVNGTQVNPYNKLTDSVGGRNLLTGTGNHTVTGATAQGYLSNETTDDLLTLFKGLEGQTVTVSVDYEYSGFIAGSNRNRIGWEITIIADTASHFGPWCYPMTPNNSGSGRISSTFVVPKNITGIDESMGYIQFSGSGTGTLSHLKLEKGNVATDWTPAPEDKVNVSDMRKAPSDVAGIDEVNAKADDSKVSILQTQVDNSAVGTNLLLGTVNNKILIGKNIPNQVTLNYLLANGYNISSLASAIGTQFTVSFDWSVSGSSPSGKFVAQWNGYPWGIGQETTVSSLNTSGHFSGNTNAYTDSGNTANMIGFRLDNFVGTLTVYNFKLEKGSKATDWCPNPDDKVNVSDMRKPASDVAGIEEVNAKQDKIGYTPADDSKAVHTSDTSNWQKNKVTSDDGSPLISLTSSNQDLSATLLNLGVGLRTVYAGNSVQNNPFSGVSSAKGVVDIQANPSGSGAFGEGFLIGTKPNQEIIMYHVWVVGSKVTYTQIANDSAVAHLSGANNFDTVPTVNNNPLLLASSLPSTLADTTKLSNFTAGLQSNGTSVATSTDLSKGLATKADDSKVVHSTDMRTPASDVAGIEEVNTKQDKIGYTPANDSKVVHLSGANNFDTVPTVNNTPLLTSDKLPDNIVKQGDAIGNINYVMYLASYPTTVGQLAVADGTVDSTKTKFITTAKVYPIPTNVTSMIWETPQINMPLLVGNVIAFYDTSGKFISANAYDATTSYQLINIPKNAYSFKISCGSNSLNSVKLFSGSSYIDSSPYPIVMGVRIKDKRAATTDDVTNAINTATANSADVSKANTFSKQQIFSTNPTNGTTNGTQVWKFTADSNVMGVTADTSGNVYAGTAGKSVYKLNSTGSQIWKFTADSYVHSVAVDTSGNVYAGTDGNSVYKINSTGSQVWQFTADNSVNSVAVDTSGNVYAGTSGKSVYKINSSGSKAWQFTADSFLMGVAVDTSGNVYAGTFGKSVYKLDSTGSQVWQFTADSSVMSVAVDTDGNVYTGTYGNSVYKLNSTGSQIWKFTADSYVHSVAVDTSGNVYAGTDGKSVYKINSTGSQVWQFTADNVVNSVAVNNSGNVYAGTNGKSVYRINSTLQVYPIYATSDTDDTAATLIASLQSSGFSGMVGVPES